MRCDTAIVLCGGIGSRFREISKLPKILSKFQNGKFIDYIIEYLKMHNIKNIVFSVGYKHDYIIKYIKEKEYLDVSFIIEDKPLNTGGAILNVQRKLLLSKNQRYLVLNGDTYWSESLPDLLFDNLDKSIILCAHSVLINDRYGNLILKNNKLEISRGSISNKIYNSLVYSGIASIPASFLNEQIKPLSVEELFTSWNEFADFKIHTLNSEVIDFGTTEGYEALQSLNVL